MTPYYEDDFATIYHGDCRELTDWLRADVLVTDPPYGQAYRSNRTKNDRIAREIEGDADTTARDAVLELWGDRPAIVFGGRSVAEPDHLLRLVWHKPGAGMGDLSIPWRPDYEFIHVRGRGWQGDYRGSSVLTYPVRIFRGDTVHPHQKPVELLRDLIDKSPAGVIADPFMGSGSTLRAAKDLGRKVVGVETDERYCEIAVGRLAQEVLAL